MATEPRVLIHLPQTGTEFRLAGPVRDETCPQCGARCRVLDLVDGTAPSIMEIWMDALPDDGDDVEHGLTHDCPSGRSYCRLRRRPAPTRPRPALLARLGRIVRRAFFQRGGEHG